MAKRIDREILVFDQVHPGSCAIPCLVEIVSAQGKETVRGVARQPTPHGFPHTPCHGDGSRGLGLRLPGMNKALPQVDVPFPNPQ